MKPKIQKTPIKYLQDDRKICVIGNIKKKKTKYNILRNAVLYSVIFTLVILCAFLFLNAKLGNAVQTRAYRLLSDAAHVQKAATNERVESYFTRLQIMASSLNWDCDIYTDSDLLAELKELARGSQFENVGISDTSGKILYQDGTKKDCADREYIKNAIEGNRSTQFLSRGRMSGDSILVFALPVYSYGVVSDVIVATKKVSDISRELGGIELNDEQHCFLCYESGTVVAAPQDNSAGIVLGSSIQDFFINDSAPEEIPINEVREYTYNGEKYFGVYTESGLDDVYIFSVATVSYASSLAGLYNRLATMIIVAAFIVFFIVAVNVIIRMARKIKEAERQDLERRKKLSEYHEFQNKRSSSRANVLASYHINITENKSISGKSAINSGKFENLKTVDEFYAAMAEDIHPLDKIRFDEIFSVDGLKKVFENGESTVQGDFLFYENGKRYIWLRIVADLVRNPLNDSLETIISAIDINRGKRLEQIGDKLIKDGFDSIGLIDVKSGCVYGTKKMADSELFGGFVVDKGVLYDRAARIVLKRVLTKHDYDYIIESFMLSNVIHELENKQFYFLTTRFYNRSAKKDLQYRISFSYIDERKESILVSSEDISHVLASKTDIETGLLNSTGFHEKVEKWLEENPNKKYRVYRYILDGFNDINGVYGFETGNKLLRDVGVFMRMHNDENSFSAHLNANHFVRFCSEDHNSAETVLKEFNEYFSHYDIDYPLSIHIGVYDLCEENCDSLAMVYKAYIALQSLETSASKRIAYYAPGLLSNVQSRRELLGELKSAISGGQFEIWFQPQIDYKTKSIVGAEALVRWRHPERGFIPPSEFIPLLERSRQITVLDRYVWEQCCRYVRHLMDMGVTLPVSVNVSRVDIEDIKVCDIILEYVKKYKISPELIKLEITESAYMSRRDELKNVVTQFKKAGFTVEMDDFGEGYSSLNILKDSDVDVLKLDMNLTAGIEDAKTVEILKSVVNMAHNLNVFVIAEGVESKAQADTLASLKCRYMQGYFFGKPMPAAEFEKLLKERDIKSIQ